MAARKIKEKARAMAAHLLEAAVEDIDYNRDNPREIYATLYVSLLGNEMHKLRSFDPEQPITTLSTMEEVLDREVFQRRLQTTLLAGFAALALHPRQELLARGAIVVEIERHQQRRHPRGARRPGRGPARRPRRARRPAGDSGVHRCPH